MSTAPHLATMLPESAGGRVELPAPLPAAAAAALEALARNFFDTMTAAGQAAAGTAEREGAVDIVSSVVGSRLGCPTPNYNY
jgi:hypothetical protein